MSDETPAAPAAIPVDEPGAIPMFVDRSRVFIEKNDHMWLAVHKTASPGSAQDIAHFFMNDPAMASTHYVVGQDGTIVQCVREVDGAGGNCCVDPGHADFLPSDENLNLRTVSVEHCDPDPHNSTPLTPEQQAASFRLIRDICKRHNIPMRRAVNDGKGGIIGHNDIAPINRKDCPNVYPWNALWAYLSVPDTWINADQEAAALAMWQQGQSSIDYDTDDMALAWQEAYRHGHFFGAPRSDVVSGGKTWKGVEVNRFYCQFAWCERQGQIHHWYNESGLIFTN